MSAVHAIGEIARRFCHADYLLHRIILSDNMILYNTLLSHKKGALSRAFPCENLNLCGADVLRLPALRPLCHIECHLLPFLQAAETTGLNGREMHEYIFAVLPADEPIALGIVKPLHCSLFHKCSFCSFVVFTLEGVGKNLAGYWLLRRELLYRFNLTYGFEPTLLSLHWQALNFQDCDASMRWSK